MLTKLTEDLYPYLKGRWWGKLLIFAAVLGIIIFILWGSLTPTQKESLLPLATKGHSEAPTAAVSTSVDRTLTDEELIYRNLVLNTCRDIADPRRQYELARHLDASPTRDAELASLVVDSACVGDEKFALELLNKVASVDQRDSAARRVSELYLKKRQFADAEKWADLLSTLQDREWWTRRILEASRKSG